MKPIDRLSRFIGNLVGTGQIRSVRKLEGKCGLYIGTIANHQRGSGYLNGELLIQINKFYPELNMDWVILGRGEMIYGKTEKRNRNKIDKEDVPENNEEYNINNQTVE